MSGESANRRVELDDEICPAHQGHRPLAACSGMSSSSSSSDPGDLPFSGRACLAPPGPPACSPGARPEALMIASTEPVSKRRTTY